MRYLLTTVLIAAALGCGDDGETATDTGADTASTGMCRTDLDCEDDAFCNGEEACRPEDSAANERGCVPGALPCTGACIEAEDMCDETDCPDADGDGATDSACGGTDCDDDDPNRYPGNTEVCDVDDLDEDCDPMTFGFRDLDGDSFPDIACCNGEVCGNDCNDSQPSVNPTAPETCDGLDNDCDGDVDEGAMRTFWIDDDGDTFGAAESEPLMACDPPSGYVENDDDCSDSDGDVSPGASEVCDEGCMPDGTGCDDENCDGEVETDCTCTAGEMRGCDEPGACSAGVEVCDAATGSWGACSITGIPETCNGVDDDCNGVIDDAADSVRNRCWRDADGDGYAAEAAELSFACGPCPAGTTDREPVGAAIDCNDEPTMNGNLAAPGRPEVCDGFDNDCSSGGGPLDDEDEDGDGHTDVAYGMCSGGFPTDDCDDSRATVFTGQTAYFSEPVCPPGTRSGCGISAVCPSGMCTASGSCTSEACVIPAEYNYDCNPTVVREPPVSGCSGSCSLSACPSIAGPMYSGTPGCGSFVPRVSCGCSATMTCRFSGRFSTRLGCR